MSALASPSIVSLLIQGVATLVMSLLCLVLMRTIGRAFVGYWALGWAALFVALSALWVAFQWPETAVVTQPLYLLGEYVFGFMMFAGCRRYAEDVPILPRERLLIMPAAALAVGLPVVTRFQFNVFFVFHSLVYAYLFFLAFRAIRRASVNPRTLVGQRILAAALLLLGLCYLQYAPLFTLSAYGVLPQTLPYLEYSSLYDLVLLVTLMFGTIMVVMGDVQHELETANHGLAEAHLRLEERSRLDHLTSALNRHALHALIADLPVARRGVWWGSAIVADIDDLKSINDRFGHAAGDAAIRAVAGAIRECIRADDLLFRWGGDEFVVLLVGVEEREARTRLGGLNERLRQLVLRGAVPSARVDLSVSMGYAAFTSESSLDHVIALADQAMYGRKRGAAERGALVSG